MSSPANEFCKYPTLLLCCTDRYLTLITSGFVKKWQLCSLFDSSLPAAVRMCFLLFASCAAAGGKAHKLRQGVALPVAKLANYGMGEVPQGRGDLNSCTKCFGEVPHA